jgi:hypothetical protein
MSYGRLKRLFETVERVMATVEQSRESKPTDEPRERILLSAGREFAERGYDAATIRDAVGILADAHVRLARGQGAELWWRDAGAAAADDHQLEQAIRTLWP